MRIVKALAVALALAVGASYAQITIPNTFAPGTTIRSSEVNTNFSELGTKALNRTGGTMTGHLLFTDNTYDIGASGATRPRRIYVGTEVVSPLFSGTTATFSGTVTGDTFSGSGANLTDIPWAAVLKTGSSLADLATRSASDLSSGTLPDARFPATLPAASGVNLTSLNATNLASGTVADARLGTNVAMRNAANNFSTNYQRVEGTGAPTRTAGTGVELGVFSSQGFVQAMNNSGVRQMIFLVGSDSIVDGSATARLRVGGTDRLTLSSTLATLAVPLAVTPQDISGFTHEESALAVSASILTYTQIDNHKHLRGMVAGASGQTVRIYNHYNSTRNVVLGIECTSASAANRIAAAGGDGVTTPSTCSGGVTIGFGRYVDLIYSGTRWDIMQPKTW